MLSSSNSPSPTNGGRSSNGARAVVVQIDASDFDNLYKLLRGNTYSKKALSALDLFQAQQFQDTANLVKEIQKDYNSTHNNISLPDKPELDNRFLRNHRQVLEVINKLSTALEYKIKLLATASTLKNPGSNNETQAQEETQAKESSFTENGLADSTLPKIETKAPVLLDARLPLKLKDELAKCADKKQEYEILRKYFKFTLADKLYHIKQNEFYYLLFNDKSYFTRISSTQPISSTITLRYALEHKSLKPIPIEALLDLGKQKRFLKLTLRECESAIGESNIHHSNPDDTETTESDKTPNKFDPYLYLNPGAFGHLMTAAQNSGIVPDYSNITLIRDQEFKLGKYTKTHQLISSMFQDFMTASAQKNAEIKSFRDSVARGKKMGLSVAQIRDKNTAYNMQIEAISRARTKFMEVIGCLDTIVKFSSSPNSQPSDSKSNS